MICSDTIEEKIMKLQMKKRKLAQDLIQTDASFFGSLSKDDLLEIL
jgi:SNF2 family DNA or RNA helicase